ncbi:hypothetical protein Patl1_00190 [Pistacia atlantica]|uniref:Uncharacterized protein n=1 Tax=Pistacia atlantica TaxID=434234 RepID=A0ACC1C673_9ROSI|nr:hypothetical protein Patl1_00190 [Pistacia atlantica]
MIFVEEAETISTSAPNKKAKTSHQPAVCNKDKSTAVDKLLAKFIISNNFLLDVSKTPFLADLLKSIAEFGPTYELPNYLALKSQMIPDAREKLRNTLQISRDLSRKQAVHC